MKKLLIAMLSVIALLVLNSCKEMETDDVSMKATGQNTTMITELQTTTPAELNTSMQPQTTPTTQEFTFPAEMPSPFDGVGGPPINWDFDYRYVERIYSFSSVIGDEFRMYLGLSDEQYLEAYIKRWGKQDFRNLITDTGLMDFGNLFAIIIEFDIPDDVVVAAIKKSNEFYYERGEYDNIILSEEDIEVLLSRDEKRATAHFATDYAIVIDTRAYSPLWLYYNTPEDYVKAGITHKMVKEKLNSYSEIELLTNEAVEAFSKKLSTFMNEKVELQKNREHWSVDGR